MQRLTKLLFMLFFFSSCNKEDDVYVKDLIVNDGRRAVTVEDITGSWNSVEVYGDRVTRYGLVFSKSGRAIYTVWSGSSEPLSITGFRMFEYTIDGFKILLIGEQSSRPVLLDDELEIFMKNDQLYFNGIVFNKRLF